MESVIQFYFGVALIVVSIVGLWFWLRSDKTKIVLGKSIRPYSARSVEKEKKRDSERPSGRGLLIDQSLNKNK